MFHLWFLHQNSNLTDAPTVISETVVDVCHAALILGLSTPIFLQ